MHRSLRTALPLALAVALAVPVTASYAEQSAAPRASVRTTGDEPLLKHAVAGRAAIRALGDDLDEAARRSRMSTSQLREVLTTDSTATVFPSGRLAYVDTFDDSGDGDAPAVPPTRSEADVDPALTFTRHSRPGADRTIYLDFQGEFVSGTAWNVSADNPDGIPNQTYDRFSLDGDFSSTYSQAEHNYIQEVWRIISETYSEFDVDVTTQDPGAAAYNRSDAGDFTYGDHVLFTDDPSSNSICDPASGCGGVAFVGTFDDPYDTAGEFEPAWVRTFDTAFEAAMAASHEIGHTLGLRHDGRTSPSEAYYEGQGAWTPIMGAGVNAIHQFSNGDYANANNKQDDFAVMLANGLPRLPDDVGDTQAKAVSLGGRTSFSVPGVISSRSDVDWYRIGPCTAAPTMQVVNAGSGSSLDLSVLVLKTDGSQVTYNNPASGQNAGSPNTAFGMNTGQFVASPVPADGYYYLRVDGVGNGNPLTTGYSDYGSVGTYTVNATGCTAANGAVPNPPTGLAFNATKGNATVSWNAPASGAAVAGYRISGLPGGAVEVPAGTTSKAFAVNGGLNYDLEVVAFNNAGASTAAQSTEHVYSFAPTSAPTVSVSTKVLTANLTWAPPANPGGAGLSFWRITLLGQNFDIHPSDRTTSFSFSGYGTFTAKLTAVYDAEDGSQAPSRTFQIVIATKPSAPKIGTATSGAKGKPVTATARWTPRYNGGAAVTAYKVIAYKLSKRGKIVGSKVSRALPGSARAYAFPLGAGKYKFRVVAYNVKGGSVASAYSRTVTAR